MKEYSPKRRTALVLSGSGTAGAYHAGVLKALDESGVKIDLLVGSGAGAVAAAFSAVAGGPKLYGAGGFWDGLRFHALYDWRLGLRIGAWLLLAAFAFFLLPVVLALLLGLLFPLIVIVDMVRPGLGSQVGQGVWAAPEMLRTPYLIALSLPLLLLALAATLGFLRLFLRDRRRVAEAFESVLDPRPGVGRLARGLWEVARGSALSAEPPSEAELGKRYVALAVENLGQPGFRELIVRTADLETGGVLPFVLLEDAHRTRFASSRVRGKGSRRDGIPDAVDLRADNYAALLFDAVMTGLLPAPAAPVRRVAFPKGGIHAGEIHRLSDATLAGGSGLSEALAAGADQVIVVTATPERPGPPPRRRGAWALADGFVSTLERQAVDLELRTAERINRMVETLGHRTDDGRAWQDPQSGRLFRDVALYVVRPERRTLGPLELDGGLDPATEVLDLPEDLVDLGYRDAYRLFVEPVFGSEPRPTSPVEEPEDSAVEL